MPRALVNAWRALVVSLVATGTAGAVNLSPDQVIGAVSAITSSTIPGSPYWSGASVPYGGSKSFVVNGVLVTVQVSNGLFAFKALTEMKKFRDSQGFSAACDPVAAGLAWCNEMGAEGYASVTAYEPSTTDKTAGFAYRINPADVRCSTWWYHPSSGGFNTCDPASLRNSFLGRKAGLSAPNGSAIYMATKDFYMSGTVPPFTAQAYNDKIAAWIVGGLNYDKPNLQELQSQYGVRIIAEEVIAEDPWQCEKLNINGGCGAQTAPGTPTQNPAGPGDTATSCGILDIPCNLRKLFIPQSNPFQPLADAMKNKIPFSVIIAMTNVTYTCSSSFTISYLGSTQNLPLDWCFGGLDTQLSGLLRVIGAVCAVWLLASIARFF